MTDYTAITDTQVDPDAPLTSQLGYQFRDNPIAIAEGSVGAPPILMNALGKFTAGTTRRFFDATERNNAGNVYQAQLSRSLGGSGVLRVAFDLKNNTGGAVGNGRITVNGVQQAIFNATGAYVTHSADVTMPVGGRISVETISNGTVIVSVRNIEFLTNGEKIMFVADQSEVAFT